MSVEEQASSIAEELIKARMLAAEREHTIVELASKLERYENFADLVGDEDDEAAREEEELDMKATELWLSGNEHISNGEIAQGVSSYTSSMSSLLHRFQELKQRLRAKELVDVEVKQRWVVAKEEELAQKLSEYRQQWELEREEEQGKLRQALEQQQLTELQDHKQQMAELQDQKQDLLERTSQLVASNSELQAQKQQLEQDLLAQKQALDQDLLTQKALESQKQVLEQALESQKQASEQALESQKQQLLEQELQAEKHKTNEVQELQTKLQSHEEQTAQLLKKYHALKEEHKALKRTGQQALEQVQLEHDAELLVLQQDLAAAQNKSAQVLSLQDENLELNNQVFELEAELGQLKQAKDQDVAQIQQAKEQVEQDLWALQQAKDRVEQDLQMLQQAQSQQLAQLELGFQHLIGELQQQVNEFALASSGERRECETNQYSLLSELQTCQLDLVRLQEQSVGLNSALHDKQQALAEMQTRLDKASQTGNEWEMEARQLKARIAELTSALEAAAQAHQRDLQVKLEQLEQCQNENIELNDQVFELQAENQHLRIECEGGKLTATSQAQVQTAELQQALAEAKFQLDSLEHESAAHKALVTELQSQLAESVAQMDAVKAQAQARVTKIQSEAKARMNKVQVEAKAMIAKAEEERQASGVEQQASQLLLLQGEVHQLTAQLESVREENAALITRLEAERTELTGRWQSENSSLTTQLSNQLAATRQIESDLVLVQTGLDIAQREAQQSLAQLDVVQQRNNELGFKLDSLEHYCADQQAKFAQQLDGMQSENLALGDSIFELQAENANLAAQKTADHGQFIDLNKQVFDLQQEVVPLRRSIYELKDEIHSLQGDNARLIKSAAGVEQQAQASLQQTELRLEVELATLQEIVSTAYFELQGLRESLASAQEQYEALDQDKRLCEVALDALQNKLDSLAAVTVTPTLAPVVMTMAPRRGLNLACNEHWLHELEATLLGERKQAAYLEQELKRSRQESQFNTQNLQSECEALRRRLEEMGLEQESRSRTRSESVDQGSARKARERAPPTLLRQYHHADTPESKSMRQRRNSVPELREIELLDEQQDLAAWGELRRARQEFALASKNLQSECDALRRRVEELELELEAKSEAMVLASSFATSSPRLPPPPVTRTASGIEAQRDSFPLETPESRRFPEVSTTTGGTASPVAFSLDRGLEAEEAAERKTAKAKGGKRQGKKHGAVATAAATTNDQEEVTTLRATIAELEHLISQLQAKTCELEITHEAVVVNLEQELAGLRQDLANHQQQQQQQQQQREEDEANEADEEDEQEVARLEARVRELERAMPRAEEVEKALLELQSLQLASSSTSIAGSMVALESQAQSLVLAVEALELQRHTIEVQLKTMLGTEGEDESSAMTNDAVSLARAMVSELGQQPTLEAANQSDGKSEMDRVIAQIRACLLPVGLLHGEDAVDWVQTAKQLEKDKRELANRLRRSEAELASRVEFFSHSRLFPQQQQGRNEKGDSQQYLDEKTAMQTPVREDNRLDVTPWKNAAYSNSSARSSVNSTWSQQPPYQHQQRQQAEWTEHQPEWNEQQQQPEWNEQQQQPEWNEQQQQQPEWSEQQQQPEWNEQQQTEWNEQQQQPEWTEQQPAWTEQQQSEWNNQQQPTWTEQNETVTVPEPAAAPTNNKDATKKKKTARAVGPSVLAVAFGIGSYHPEWKPDPKELEDDNSDFEGEVRAKSADPITPGGSDRWFQPPPEVEYEPRLSWQGDVEPEQIWNSNGEEQPSPVLPPPSVDAHIAAPRQEWNNGQWEVAATDNNNHHWQEEHQPLEQEWPQQQPEQEWQQHQPEEAWGTQQEWNAYVEQTPVKTNSSFAQEKDTPQSTSTVNFVDPEELTRLISRITELKEELAQEREARLLREGQCASFESALSLIKSEMYTMESKHEEELNALTYQLEQKRPLLEPTSQNGDCVEYEAEIVVTSIQQETMQVYHRHVSIDDQAAAATAAASLELEAKLSEALETIHHLRAQILESATDVPLISTPQGDEEQKDGDKDAVEQLRAQIKLREEDVTKLVAQLSTVTYELLSVEERARRTSPTTLASMSAVAFALAAVVPPDAIVSRLVDLFQSI